jgi:hypothetical protein
MTIELQEENLQLELAKFGQMALNYNQLRDQIMSQVWKVVGVGRRQGLTDPEINSMLRKELEERGISERSVNNYLPQELKNQNRVQAGKTNILTHQQFSKEGLLQVCSKESERSAASLPLESKPETLPTIDPQPDPRIAELEGEVHKLKSEKMQMEYTSQGRNDCTIPLRYHAKVWELIKQKQTIKVRFSPTTGEAQDILAQ